jgi:hypothetical protein
MSIANDLGRTGMQVLWGVTFLVVAVFGFAVTPWEAIAYLLESGGVDSDGAALIGFAAGFTLPLTAGFFIITLAVLTDSVPPMHPWVALGVAAGILWLCGEAARYFGLGLTPDYKTYWAPGPPQFRPITVVLQAYFNSYGWPLMLCALAIGVTGALQLARVLHPATSDT